MVGRQHRVMGHGGGVRGVDQGAAATLGIGRGGTGAQVQKIYEIEASAQTHETTGIAEFDRVLGGGIVDGSLMLVGGEPAPDAEAVIERLKACHADGVDIRYADNIDEAYVAAFRKAGLSFAVWTVDTPETARKYLDLGVDAITSNRAAWLMKMFNEK